MTVFVVEDGTGLSTATSYVDLTFADDYLGASWATDDPTKQAALIDATEYIDAKWGAKLMGQPLDTKQSLEFPRYGLYNRYGDYIEGLPNNWLKAVCLYAKESLSGSLYPTPPSASSKDVESKETTVGPVTTKVKYRGSNTAASFLSFPLADKLVKQFVYGAGGIGQVIRN